MATPPLAVVTGVAGFIGSHLADSLVNRGYRVRGIDCFGDNYPSHLKRENLAAVMESTQFDLIAADLATCDIESLILGSQIVFHHAAQSGVRTSFAPGFAAYCTNNVLATQRVLQAATATAIPRLVFASSSSVYGNAVSYPTSEDDLPRPYSPYGVTKLAAEHLCNLYAANWRLPTVSLRYFTVYGPRQRPDMAINRLFTCALRGTPFSLYGTGDQIRDFTYVSDVVDATVAAAQASLEPGTVINITGGTSASMREVISIVEELTGRRLSLLHQPNQAGDVGRTGGSSDRARALLGWTPKVDLRDGLERQLGWHHDTARVD